MNQSVDKLQTRDFVCYKWNTQYTVFYHYLIIINGKITSHE
jgi:hypothetical protein